MNAANCALANGLVSAAYVQQGQQALTARCNLVKSLLSQRKLPVDGWDDANIEMLLQVSATVADSSIVLAFHVFWQSQVNVWMCCMQDAASMDSNNFLNNIGVGEREARVASDLVARRHYRLAHGMGRSGDVAAEQPKVKEHTAQDPTTACVIDNGTYVT